MNWLVNANEEAEARLSHAAIEEKIMMMRRPVSIERSYALFGLLLGSLPSAAIFYRILDNNPARHFDPLASLLILGMYIVCCLAGRFIGSRLSPMILRVARGSWKRMLIWSPLVGLLWGASVGAMGGAVLFGIGAIPGAICAIPVGLLAFSLFMPLHRLLAHGGMIEAQHLWPLACGVTLTLTALILGL